MMDKYISLAKLYDSFSFDASANNWAGYIGGLLEKGGAGRGAGIADIGCGTGKITLELYKKGYNITAIDSSEEMLEVAAFRFAENGARIQTINQDMREMKLHRKADAAICVNDGINYLTSPEDVLRAFKSIYEALNDGGVFLFDISSKHKLKSMDGKSFFEEKDEGLYIWASEYDKKSDMLEIEISLYCHYEDNLYEKSLETHRQKAYEISELQELLEKAGFSDISVYRCFSENEPAPDTDRIQFSAIRNAP